MYNQGMNFDIENTTWWKQDGSDHFKVRSVFFDGAGMSIQTYDGRMINGDVLKDYIQSEEPIKKPKTPPAPKINKAALLQGMSPEELGDVFLNTPGVGSNLDANPKPKPQPSQPVFQESANDIIIKRMMDNLGIPVIRMDIKIEVEDGYADKLKNLAEVMNINMDDIKAYMRKNIKDEDIQKEIDRTFSETFYRYFQDPNISGAGL